MFLGYKIDNCDCPENETYFNNLLLNLTENQPIEIGLECYEPRQFNKNSEIITLFSEKLNCHENKIVHLTLTAKVLNINAFSFQEWTDILLEQLELVEKINPRYIIIHATSKESKLFSEEEQIKNICINLRYLQAFFKKPIFIENTFEDLSFYENLFEKADKKLNFVFDIGHKKVHSKKSNESWILFLKGLREKGRKIHFHIHDNNGIYDLHKTLSFYKNEETIAFVKELMEIFPEFNFILESHSANFENIRCDYDLLTN